jgi:GNAT superfamily N-acetyltransferase
LVVNRLALDFTLTPETVAHICQADPRPFPCLAIYAVEDGHVLGQAGILRLPMVSTEGREDIGGIWGISTHPQHAGRRIAARLLHEAHARMRQAGLRFSTLIANRNHSAYRLFLRHGYVEMNVWATALARWETAHQPTRLRLEPAGPQGYDLAELVFDDVARHYLGFAWRHIPFAPLRRVDLNHIWMLRENTHTVGYAIVHPNQDLLLISNLVLQQETDPAEAVAAVVAELRSHYVQVSLSRPVEVSSLQRAGFHVARPNWDGFMVKPLTPDITADDARRLFAIGTNRFLISRLDFTYLQ